MIAQFSFVRPTSFGSLDSVGLRLTARVSVVCVEQWRGVWEGKDPMSEQFKVFYCWQSDTNQNHGRYLIQEALNKAAELLATDSSIRFPVYIDQATLDEPGLCDIPNTILRKLASADAVVADLTFIAKTAATEENEKVKYCSNPNVLFELGYAFHAIGPERIVLNRSSSKSERHAAMG